jgi:hypothetical protein
MAKRVKKISSWLMPSLSLVLLAEFGSLAQLSNGPAEATARPTSNALKLLDQLVEEEVASDTNFLGRTRFRILSDQNELTYDLAADPPSAVLSEKDPLAVPLEALLRVKCLRRDFQREAPGTDFWVRPLAQASQAARQAVDDFLSATNGTSRQRQLELRAKEIEASFATLEDGIRGFAAQRGLDIERRRGINDSYDVWVEIEPPRARLRYMTYLAYRKSTLPPPLAVPLDEQWNTLLPGKNELIGRYHCLADWPAELGGTETNDFTIRRNCSLVFRPPKK